MYDRRHNSMTELSTYVRVCVCACVSVYELNNRTLKAKQSRFIAFHLPNIPSLLSFGGYLHKHIFTDSFRFVTGKSVRATNRIQKATAHSQPKQMCKQTNKNEWNEWMNKPEREREGAQATGVHIAMNNSMQIGLLN